MQTTQQHRTLRSRIKQDAGRRRNQKRQAKKRSAIHTRYGFLKKSFLPVITQKLAHLGKSGTVESAFFNSLDNLNALYNLNVTRSCLPYPFNISESFNKAKEALKKVRPDLEIIIANDKSHKTCLATIRTYNTGCCLYYIPVKPLAELLRKHATNTQGNLILSIFAYLHQVAAIPYFIDDYLGGTYEMIKDWYEQDPTAFDAEELDEVLQSFRVMDYFSKKMYRSIKHPYHLSQFEKRLKSFIPQNAADEQLRYAASRFLSLYKRNPQRSLFSSFHPLLLQPEENERIYPDQYISFFWEGTGSIYDQLIETVNASLQEMAIMDEPLALQFFNTPQENEHHDLSFEEFFFESIHLLCEILN